MRQPTQLTTTQELAGTRPATLRAANHLDIGLPGTDGLLALNQFKAQTAVSVIFVSAAAAS